MALVTFGASQAFVKPSIAAAEQGWFSQVTCSVAGNILVKGTGIKEFIVASGGGTGHIDPATGVAFTGNVASTGYYEALPATTVTIAMAAGDTIGGAFLQIATGSGFKGWGVSTSIDASGPEYQFAS
tara:strand:+ start:547 stop:927 length:381 start_codon:yes stop_codon:yes gene_type:complete